MATQHLLHPDAIPDRGRYWYRCALCGAADFVTTGQTKDDLPFMSKPCGQPERLVSMSGWSATVKRG